MIELEGSTIETFWFNVEPFSLAKGDKEREREKYSEGILVI